MTYFCQFCNVTFAGEYADCPACGLALPTEHQSPEKWTTETGGLRGGDHSADTEKNKAAVERRVFEELKNKSIIMAAGPTYLPLSENPVESPPHYTAGTIQPIEYIEAQGWGADYCRGNVIKYITRAGKKDPKKTIEDLDKAIWYVQRLKQILKGDNDD